MEENVQLHDPVALSSGNGTPGVGWVGPIACLDALEYRKIFCLCQKSNPYS
jgi:hypothetical protein